jgi:hypothetical protein
MHRYESSASSDAGLSQPLTNSHERTSTPVKTVRTIWIALLVVSWASPLPAQTQNQPQQQTDSPKPPAAEQASPYRLEDDPDFKKLSTHQQEEARKQPDAFNQELSVYLATQANEAALKELAARDSLHLLDSPQYKAMSTQQQAEARKRYEEFYTSLEDAVAAARRKVPVPPCPPPKAKKPFITIHLPKMFQQQIDRAVRAAAKNAGVNVDPKLIEKQIEAAQTHKYEPCVVPAAQPANH